MDQNEFPEDSDTSDEDYNPEKKPEEVVSEIDSDGDPEDVLSDCENETNGKRKKNTTKIRKKNKKLKDDKVKTEEDKPVESLTEDEKKKKEDELWADFMQDTGFKPKSQTQLSQSAPKDNAKNESLPEQYLKKNEEKVKITQIFEFAGEEVKVEKEVAKDSAEARLLSNPSTAEQSKPAKSGLKGIGSVLSQLGKKKKISTLEKSKLDWDKFKKDENIEEEILNFNKGKHGYLDKKDFLERADLRRFEIEKEIRAVERSKRPTTTNSNI